MIATCHFLAFAMSSLRFVNEGNSSLLIFARSLNIRKYKKGRPITAAFSLIDDFDDLAGD